jgi:hypothetical protein
MIAVAQWFAAASRLDLAIFLSVGALFGLAGTYRLGARRLDWGPSDT